MSTMLGEPMPVQSRGAGLRQQLAAALALLALGLAFAGPLRFMAATWHMVEEYGYGWFVPPIVAFLVWQKQADLARLSSGGSWGGLALVVLGLLMQALGELSAIRLFGQHGFVVAVFGLAACALGWRGLRMIALPLALLFLMVPLPQFALREVSQTLQLISSQIGVMLIRAFDISVFLEGNVIDLGGYQLQVVEACSGLRYLFPLIVLGVLAAYFFAAPLWQRVLVVVATVPLAILINSLRIGVIGITVEHWGRDMAEGLLHDFEGGAMFLLCMAGLVALMALLARLNGSRLRDALAIDLPPVGTRRTTTPGASMPWPVLATAGLAGAVAVWLVLAPARVHIEPQRQSFNAFPLTLEGGWAGRTKRLEPDVLATLALDDYLLADYSREGTPPVNVYAAYYAAQTGGESSHSPRTCIPGGGWSIDELRIVGVPLTGGQSVPVNRALITKGEHRQLVYYWFRQRGANMTGEFSVKWAILRDGVSRGRTDGALLRLVTPLAAGEAPEAADRRLAQILGQMQPQLPAYVPD